MTKGICRKKWTKEEIQKLTNFFPITPKKELLILFPDRTYPSIVMKASVLQLKANNSIHIRMWKDDEILLLKDKYSSSLSKNLLNFFPNRTKVSINLKAKELGLTKNNSIYRTTNLDILLNDSLSTYYWLGFIFADGTILNNCRLRVTLSIKDESHLIKLAKYLNTSLSTYKIKTKYSGGKEFEYCMISLQNKDIIPMITKKFDIKRNKTKNPPNINILKKMTDNQFISFLIGYIDGDGSIPQIMNRKDFNIRLKCHSTWKRVYNYFKIRIEQILQKKFNNKVIINNRGYCVLTFSNCIIINFLANFNIIHSLPVLERKWSKIKEVMPNV